MLDALHVIEKGPLESTDEYGAPAPCFVVQRSIRVCAAEMGLKINILV